MWHPFVVFHHYVSTHLDEQRFGVSWRGRHRWVELVVLNDHSVLFGSVVRHCEAATAIRAVIGNAVNAKSRTVRMNMVCFNMGCSLW